MDRAKNKTNALLSGKRKRKKARGHVPVVIGFVVILFSSAAAPSSSSCLFSLGRCDLDALLRREL